MQLTLSFYYFSFILKRKEEMLNTSTVCMLIQHQASGQDETFQLQQTLTVSAEETAKPATRKRKTFILSVFLGPNLNQTTE